MAEQNKNRNRNLEETIIREIQRYKWLDLGLRSWALPKRKFNYENRDTTKVAQKHCHKIRTPLSSQNKKKN